MKIVSIEPVTIGIPYTHDAPRTPSGDGNVRELMDAVYLKVETDAGITGWGEVFAFGSYPIMQAACELVVKPLATGMDAGDIDATMTNLFRRTQGTSGKGPIRHALSGLDIALWDIRGKAEGKPIWRLLGGDGSRRTLPAYASLIRTGAPEHVVTLCRSAVERGYREIKLHERNELTVESVKLAREAVGGDIELMLDTNCAWLPDEVMPMARALAPFGLKWLEEPVYPTDDFRTMARVRAETGVPVAAGENLGTVQEFGCMIDADAVDFIQPDVSKFGGICEMMKAVDVAEAAGVSFTPHSPVYGPGLIATLHIAAAMKQDTICEYYYADLAESPMGSWAVPQDGMFAVPDGPGLGAEVDEDAIARFRLN